MGKSPRKMLNRNEMAVRPSPAVIRALRSFDPFQASFYFSGYYGSRLVPELAKRFGLAESQVSVGYGAEFFLRSIFDTYSFGKDVVLANVPHYNFYSLYAKAKHVRFETFRMVDRGDRFEFDIDDCLAKLRQKHPKVLLIISPNNPTGNSIPLRDFKKILRAARPRTLVVLDEAYMGFSDAHDERSFLGLLKKYENLMILRTFSKRYALAGLRIGFALWGKRGNKSAKAMLGYEDFYLGGSRLLEDVAIAALRSGSYYRKISRQLMADRKAFIEAVNHLQHFKAYASDASFVLVKVDKEILRDFEKKFSRLNFTISKFVMPQFLRVSLGARPQIAQFLKALREVDTLR